MSLIGNTNEEKIWNYLFKELQNPYGCAGVMGNMYAESALNPKNLQNTYEKSLGYTDESYTAAVDNGSYDNFINDKAGYGLVQWTYWSLKRDLLNYVKAKKVSIGDLEIQLEFLCKELKEDFPKVWNVLKSSTSVSEASNTMLLQFERPSDMSVSVQQKRASYGQIYFDKYTKQTNTEKGGTTMKLVKSILTKNPCYTSGRKITVKGLMLHSVGCPQPKASVFINNWNSASYNNACVHAFIDANDGTVYQTLPWNHRGWHCASGSNGSGNNTHIGVEMCEPSTIKYTGGSSFTCSNLESARAAAMRTYKAAVELFAMLCKEYGLNPLAPGVVISHKEGHVTYKIASNHGDPEHLWKGLGLSYTMDTFRNDVKAKMGGTTNIDTTVQTSTSTSNASKNTNFPKTPFTIKVIVSDLNIRTSGSMSGKVVGQTGKGSFTITEVKNGWGKLKSNAGWIYLENPEYCTIGKTVASSTTSTDSSNYTVRVTTDVLNIRKKATTDSAIVGQIRDKGVYTIVKESTGKGASKWGLLKSYAKNENGWISLDYCKKC